MSTKERYSIRQVCIDVADFLRGRDDHSPTTIRTAINDALDAADKNGFAVNFDYDQPSAIRSVQRALGEDAGRAFDAEYMGEDEDE